VRFARSSRVVLRCGSVLWPALSFYVYMCTHPLFLAPTGDEELDHTKLFACSSRYMHVHEPFVRVVITAFPWLSGMHLHPCLLPAPCDGTTTIRPLTPHRAQPHAIAQLQ
jgi:hypothetical protein